MKLRLAAVLSAVGVSAASAAGLMDYAQMATLSPAAAGAAVQLALPAAIEQNLISGADLQVFAGGKKAPFALCPAPAGAHQSHSASVPIHALPQHAAPDHHHQWQLNVAADGSITAQSHANGANAASTHGAVAAWILDLHALETAGQVVRFAPEWQDFREGERHFRIKQSRDLQAWETMSDWSVFQLLDQPTVGTELRVETARYLMVEPADDLPMPKLLRMTAHWQAPGRAAPPKVWSASATKSKVLSNQRIYEFNAPSGIAFTAARVRFAGNQLAVAVTLEQLNGQNAVNQAFGPFSVNAVNGEPSDLMELPALRGGRWRLTVPDSAELAAHAGLEFFSAPQQLWYVSQSAEPHQLGFASAQLGDQASTQLPCDVLLAQARGAGLPQVSGAVLGIAVSGGAEKTVALAPSQAPGKPLWQRLLLWACLAVGAILVAGMALTVLKESRPG